MALPIIESAQPFIVGMIAGLIATSITQPVDFLKTQIQLSGEGVKGGSPSALQLAYSILSAKGIGIFYTGIGAAALRQVLYGGIRLGLFPVLYDALRAHVTPGAVPPWTLKVGAALVAGAVAAFVGNPADLALVRMQAESTLPPGALRRCGGSVVGTISSIVREEGVVGLWRGSTPTVLRAMAMNVGMLVTADQIKEALASRPPPNLNGTGATAGTDSLATLIISSFVAGVAASVASLPFDAVKTRLQKQIPLPDGSLPYSDFLDCARKIATKEGPLAFYKARASRSGVGEARRVSTTAGCALPLAGI